jgi:undecaprenyl diphosphate synthase
MIVPTHVAFIMDGNRRWAHRRHLPTIAGHHAGKNRIEPLIATSAQMGIPVLTFWAFSSENWARGKKEVGFILTVFREFLLSGISERLLSQGVRMRVLGDLRAFPEDIVRGVESLVEKSKKNTRITVNFALNYGGRNEILSAVNSLLKNGIARVDEATFSSYLYTGDLPDPDLIIRTGGERRLSGFLPWQSVYSELYFSEIYWPDFTEVEFATALQWYSERERRFGK